MNIKANLKTLYLSIWLTLPSNKLELYTSSKKEREASIYEQQNSSLLMPNTLFSLITHELRTEKKSKHEKFVTFSLNVYMKFNWFVGIKPNAALE